MVDTTWTNGGGDGKASTAANWSNGIDVGYNVIFDGTSTANCTFDYDGQLGNFTIGAGYSGTITQASDMHITGYSQAGGTFTGVTTKWVYCSGDFVKTAGTVTNNKMCLDFIGDGAFSTNEVSSCYNTVKIHSSIIVNSNVGVINLYVYDSLEISSGKTLESWSGVLKTVYNEGIINGSGTLKITINSDYGITFTPGNINCFLNVNLHSSSVGSQTIALNGSMSGASVSTFISNHASNTLTLNLNGHSLTVTTITVGTRGILTNSAATDSVISCANFDSSAGTFTEANTQVIMSGNGTLKTAAGHKFDELVQRDGVTTTLGSNITVTNEFDTAGSFIQGAHSITHENPGKRIIAPMVNPIIRNPKRSPFFNNRFTKNIELEVV